MRIEATRRGKDAIRIVLRVQIAAVALTPMVAVIKVPPVMAAERCFPETGKCSNGLFYDYWLANGGLAQQGLPLTNEFDEPSPTNGKIYRVQYFERARFEYHPENAAPYNVLLGCVDAFRVESRAGEERAAREVARWRAF